MIYAQMASKFICECGYQVRTNMFEGHGIFRMVADNDIDSIDETAPAKTVIDLWFRSKELIKCKGCGSLFLWDKELKDYVQYKKVANSTKK